MNRCLALMILVCSCTSVLAAVDAGQALRLGQDLTPMGAERAGNGTDIPAWSGGLVRQDLTPERPFHPHPYASESPILRINADNLESYKARLTEGQQRLLEKFPDFYLAVYPSHRSASWPDYVYQAVAANAINARLLPYGAGVTGAVMASPFPIPGSALEVLWNHTLRFRGQTASYRSVSSVVMANGQRMDTRRDYRYFFKYSQPGMTADGLENLVFLLSRETLSPPTQAGAITLVHEPLDQIRDPRKSWIYLPGQRRLRRTPDLAYDTPDVNSDGMRTIDQVDMFNGSPDHYDWTLQGRQELLIPYNAYALHQPQALANILQPGHLNPALLRYEAHRVWVIEGILRSGVAHRYSKRRLYLDEDSWSIVYAEAWDLDGQLQQISEAHLINFHDVPLMLPTLEVTYDLPSGRYYAEGLDNEEASTMDFSNPDISENDFSTSAIRREARR